LGAVVQAYVQNRAAVDDPYVSPLFGELRGLPPLMLQVGEAEVLFDDSTRFADKAGAVGVAVNLETWPDMPHVFQMFAPFLPQASGALASIGEFVHRIRKK
jgi:acetyl esterase/lipase